MFIKKINSIDNIGSFYKYKQEGGGFEFKKINIVFGLNGHGKTTFTSIIKSLKENLPEVIVGRKSLNASDSDGQMVVIDFEDNSVGKRVRFENKRWMDTANELKSKNPNIVIFDDEFIGNNIFAEKFEIDHKKALYKIIFGKDGIILSKKIKELSEKKKELGKDYKEATGKIVTTFYKVGEFIDIDISALNQQQIQNALEAVNKQIKIFSDQEKIQKKAIFQVAQAEIFEFSTLDRLLSGKINSLAHNEAKLKIEQFKKDFFTQEEGAEGFLKFGYSNKKSSCPFCHKPLDDAQLLDTYKNFFDESYSSFLDELKKESTNFAKWNIEVVFQKIDNIIRANAELFITWKEMVPEISNLNNFDFDFNAKLMLHIKLSELTHEKMQNLNSDIPASVIDEYKQMLILLRTQIEGYNTAVETVNRQILQFKESLKKIEINELEKQKNKLLDEYKRLEPSVNALCLRAKKIAEDDKLTKTEIEKNQAKLNVYSESIKSEYLDVINKKLESIGIDNFKLMTIEEKSSGNATEAFLEIYLEILNQKVAMHDFKDDKPSFKNTLSRGDKNSLAFAFFLAFMEKKECKENVILIFDDPLSSHDENRQNMTASIIRALTEEVSQTFVLTHKKDFLCSMYSKVKGNPNLGSFAIKKSTTGSKIVLFDAYNFLKNDVEKIIDKLQNYIEEGNAAVSTGNLLNDIRKIFEHVLNAKYYLLLRHESNSLTSYKTMDKNFFQNGLLLNIKDDLVDIFQLANDGSHDPYERLNEEEIKTIIRKAFSLLEKI